MSDSNENPKDPTVYQWPVRTDNDELRVAVIHHLIPEDRVTRPWDMTRLRLEFFLTNPLNAKHPLVKMVDELQKVEQPSALLYQQIRDYFHPTDGMNAWIRAIDDEAVIKLALFSIDTAPISARAGIREVQLITWRSVRDKRPAGELWAELMASVPEEDRKAYERYGELYGLSKLAPPSDDTLTYMTTQKLH